MEPVRRPRGRRPPRLLRKKKILKGLHRRSKLLEESSSGDRLSVSGTPPTQDGKKGGKRKKKKETVLTNLKERSKVRNDGEMSCGMWDGMEVEDSGIETVLGMESWQNMGVARPIIRALKDLGFTSPTEIQRRAIPVAMDTTRDVIGAAETGSGKTLAFSIPILSYIIANDSRGVADGGRASNKPGVCHRGITSSKRREGKSAKFIDLNVVLHSEEEEDGERGDEGAASELNSVICSEFASHSEEEGEEDISGISSDQTESESEGLKGDAAHPETGLVTSLDDIPEDEFLKMISGDVAAGSHDTGDVAEQDYDVISNSDGRYQTEFGSHDLDDVTMGAHDLDGVTKGSHDPSDVTKGSHDQGLLALILTPTRELALQIQSHIREAAKYTGIKVCVLVGGMAGAKQERMLSQHPPIVVATPGRLWKLMSEGHPHLTSLDTVRYLVLDEADRMIEFGHYQELSWILERVNNVKGAESGERHRQTFVFSATLTLPRRSSEKKVNVRRKKNLSRQESVDNLISQVGLRENPVIVDVVRQSGTTETLSEMKIMCSSEDKDVYLYYFLLLYTGRTLVFVNSIATLQKLRSLLELLNLHPLPFHARMQQRQRLKNFDRFTTSSDGLLLASDVAARGLDFPDVHHVIHYHVPRNSELYIHRSGRTARAKREGLSVILIGPEEMMSYRNISKTLNRDGLPSFPMDTMYLQAIRKRISVARRIESSLHQKKKRRRDADWVRSSVHAMELELDQDWYGTETEPTTTASESDNVEDLKAELKSLLHVPILPRSVSMTYPTRDENHKLLESLKGDRKHRKCGEIVTMDTRDALTVAKTEMSRQHRPRRKR